MALGFTDPGGSRPTPNRPTSVYQSKRPSFSGFTDPGLSVGQFGFGSNDRDRNDGPNIVMKSKPVVPQMSTYDAGKKAYADFLRSRTGQSGGISSIPTQSRVASYMQLDPYGPANIRQQYFDNRFIPTERLQRRGMQDKIVDQFKQQLINTGRVLKDSRGNVVLNANTGEPVFLTDVPGGRSVSDVAQDAAFKFGPTPSELMGDASYAMGKIGSALAEKGTPMMNLAKSFIGGIQDFFMPNQAPGTTAQAPMGLTLGQLNLYNNLIGNGMNPAMALEQAKRYVPEGNFPKSFAVGGIATLN